MFHGWHRNGMKRFNGLINIIMRIRDTTENKELEIKLKSVYTDICGGGGRGTHTGGVDSLNKSDEFFHDDLEPYNIFAGGVILVKIGRV